jgi:hypothetical protein
MSTKGYGMRSSATVGELVEARFEMVKVDFSPSTVKEIRGFIDRNLLPQMGTVPRSSVVAGDGAANPRHPAPGPGAGRQVGLARREPGCYRDPATSP